MDIFGQNKQFIDKVREDKDLEHANKSLNKYNAKHFHFLTADNFCSVHWVFIYRCIAVFSVGFFKRGS